MIGYNETNIWNVDRLTIVGQTTKREVQQFCYQTCLVRLNGNKFLARLLQISIFKK